jgi:hypothetical protein
MADRGAAERDLVIFRARFGARLVEVSDDSCNDPTVQVLLTGCGSHLLKRSRWLRYFREYAAP